MTQSQIVQALAEKCEVTKKVSQGLLAALSDTAISEVKKNGVFVLLGIGRLVRVDRKARMGRNPGTGEAIKIAAKKVVKFRIAKAAKDYRAAEQGEGLAGCGKTGPIYSLSFSACFSGQKLIRGVTHRIVRA